MTTTITIIHLEFFWIVADRVLQYEFSYLLLILNILLYILTIPIPCNPTALTYHY